MPTFYTDRLLFLHVPKTGGEWFSKAAEAGGVQPRLPDLPHLGEIAHHANYMQVGDLVNGRLGVAFVRHPHAWWRSYWAHRMRWGWVEGDIVDEVAADDDFNSFIAALVERFPGYLGHVYAQFLGGLRPSIGFVGRAERLVDHTVEALRRSGERFSEDAVRATPPENAGDYSAHPALYTRENARRLAEAERVVLARFYPRAPVPPALVERRRSPLARVRRTG